MQLELPEKTNSQARRGRSYVTRMLAAGGVAFVLSLATCFYFSVHSGPARNRDGGTHLGLPSASVSGGEKIPAPEKPPAIVLPPKRPRRSSTLNIRRIEGSVDGTADAVPSPQPADATSTRANRVYNALFSSTIPGLTNGVLDGAAVSVRFYIGTLDPSNAIPPDSRSVNSALPSELLVTMSCLFCENETMQKKRIQVNGAEGTSSEADFTITPRKSRIRNSAAVGTLVFQITGVGDGILYDNVTVPVTVVQSGQTVPAMRPFVKLTPVDGEGNGPADARGADVTISCFASGDQNVLIELSTTDSELAEQLGGRQLLPDQSPRQFDTLLHVATLRRILAEDYANVTAVVENDAKLERVLSGGVDSIARLQASNNFLTDSDKTQLLTTFYAVGKDLYRQLFLVNPDLRFLADTLENYQRSDGRPMRIRIESQLFVPWQMLHPLAEMGERKFWGFRYEIVVDPQGHQPDGRYSGTSKYAKGPVLFLKYGADGNDSALDQEVGELGDLQYEFVKNNFSQETVKVETKKKFHETLKNHLADIEMIIAYTHAENGTHLERSGDDYTAVSLLTGPRLWFTRSEWLTASEFDRLPDDLLLPTITMARHPIVLLNGCETAGGGFFAVEQLDFPSIFLSFGARGVIATEAPIWDMFGYFFGESIVRGLKTGQPASSVLLQTRNVWLHDSNNPLGLLYAYYGGMDAVLTF